MKWFYNLKRMYRNLITAGILLILVIYANVRNEEVEISSLEALFTLGFLGLEIFFIVHSIKATKKERFIKQEALRKEHVNMKDDRETKRNEYISSIADDLDINISIHNFPIYTKVVGVSFENRQEYIKDSKNDEELIIKHQPTDKYPESTVVINKTTNKILGHIKADLAKDLIKTFGELCIFNGTILEITGGTDGLSYGCNITIDGVL